MNGYVFLGVTPPLSFFTSFHKNDCFRGGGVLEEGRGRCWDGVELLLLEQILTFKSRPGRFSLFREVNRKSQKLCASEKWQKILKVYPFT